MIHYQIFGWSNVIWGVLVFIALFDSKSVGGVIVSTLFAGSGLAVLNLVRKVKALERKLKE